jgi:hypothetical protein
MSCGKILSLIITLVIDSVELVLYSQSLSLTEGNAPNYLIIWTSTLVIDSVELVLYIVELVLYSVELVLYSVELVLYSVVLLIRN